MILGFMLQALSELNGLVDFLEDIMKTMEEYAAEYQKKHRGKGYVSDVTSYSFKFTTLPLKVEDKPKTYVVMKSYFWERNS